MITLRKIPPAKNDDASLIATWYNDPVLRRYMSTWVRSRTHSTQSIEQSLKDSDPTFEVLFMIEFEGRAIGHAGIDDINPHDKRAELFYCIGDPTFRGKKLSYDIVEELCTYGFEVLKLESMIATVMVTNEASTKALLRNGFILVGRIPRYNFVDDDFEDELIFSRIR